MLGNYIRSYGSNTRGFCVAAEISPRIEERRSINQLNRGPTRNNWDLYRATMGLLSDGERKEIKLFTLPISIVATAMNMANKMLIAASSAKTKLNLEGDKWNVFEHIRYLLMLALWLTVWIVRALWDHFPSPLPSSAFLETIASPCPTLSVSTQDEISSNSNAATGRAIGRALSQILALVNDIPAASRKYEFVRALADKIIEENANQGEHELEEINRMALSAAFARTVNLLNSSLYGMQRQQQDEETCSWIWRLIRMVPLYSQLMPSIEHLRCAVANLLQPQAPPTLMSPLTAQRVTTSNNGVLAEKLAQELLWITNKLGMCLAVEEAILQWSSANSLATISISAHPRVQGSLVKVSVLLFKEMAMGNFEISEQVRFKLLILWLPLLCYATNGVDSPILSALEKAEVERVLEKTITSLSELDQEVVLANWLHDYSFSSSDWPNLQNCYDGWCHTSRKKVRTLSDPNSVQCL